MRFKEIFNKYLDGKANEEEVEIVENEIEKIEIINDYLVDQVEDEFLKDAIKGNSREYVDEESTKEDNLLLDIKSAINKKLLQIGVLSASIVVGLLLSFKFLVSPIMDMFYYNPQEKINEFSTVMDLDLNVFTELHFPGVYNGFNEYEKLGFGKYKVNINQHSYFKESDSKVYSATIDKNKLEINNEFYEYLPIHSFTRDTVPFYQYPSDNDDKQIEELKKLPEYIKVEANVSFSKDLNMDEVVELMGKAGMNYHWIGIRSSDLETQDLTHIGMSPQGAGAVYGDESFDSKKYPYLDIKGENNKDGKMLQTHFQSMLKYMSENKAFGKLAMNKKTNVYYKNVLEYVNQNGVLSYGMVVSATQKELLELRENPLVEGIYIKNIKLSNLEK